MTKKNRNNNSTQPVAAAYQQSSCPSTSFTPSGQFPLYAQPLPTSYLSPSTQAPQPQPSAPECFYGLPPPPYPCSSSPCSSDTYSSSNYAPPLPQREEIVIGRHAARFNIKQDHSSSSRCKFPNQKRFINPVVSSKRKCTDIPCCFFFLFFVIGWTFVAYVGFQWGKPERLLHPTDSAGRMCGIQKKGYYDLRSKPYLLYFDITKCASYSFVIAGCQTPQICVERCPSVTYSYLKLRLEKGQEFRKQLAGKIFCKETVDKANIHDFSTLKKFVENGTCAKFTVSSAAILGRCLPDFVTNTFEKVVEISKALNQNGTAGVLQTVSRTLKNEAGNTSVSETVYNRRKSSNSLLQDSIPKTQAVMNASSVVAALIQQNSVIEKIAADISVTWWQIIVMLIATAFISFLWTIIMRLFGPFLIWATVFFVAIALSAGSGYCWWQFKLLKDEGATSDYSFYPNFNVYFEMPTTWMIIAILLSITTGIIIIILICIRNRITLAIALIQESSKAVGAISSSLFLPIIVFIMHIAIFAVWAAISLWIASSGTENCRIPDENGNLNNGTACNCSTLGTSNVTVDETTDDKQICQYVNLTRNENQILIMQIYNLVGFFWSSWFISAICDVTLAGAFASYYWAFNKKKDVPPYPMLLALRRALRYHLGTIAFGSLIITTVKMFRIILDYIDRKLNSSENKIIKNILKCFKCLFWCVEVFLKFLTKNAYIMTAIYGTSFFTAAKDSFSLIWNNAIRYAVLVKITDFLLFLGKATISIGMGVVAFYWFAGRWVIEGLPHIDLYYYFVPIIIVIGGAYVIADLFFDVYEMAVRTTFLCFLEDAENNDGTPDKPYYMSKELRKIMGKENHFKCSSK